MINLLPEDPRDEMAALARRIASRARKPISPEQAIARAMLATKTPWSGDERQLLRLVVVDAEMGRRERNTLAKMRAKCPEVEQ